MVLGSVVDTTGSPVANAVVTLNPATGPGALAVKLLGGAGGPANARKPSRGVVQVESPSTPTDHAGHFVFTNVAAGDYRVTGIAVDHLGDSKPITISAATTSDTVVVSLRLRQTGSVKGRVTLDASTDHHGTVVYAEGTSAVGVTDATGAYELSDVPLGSWTITASHTGYLDHSDPVTLDSEGQVVTLQDVVLGRDLNVPPTASIGVDGACALDPTTLTAIASDSDGSVVRYEWDFEDDGRVDTSGASLDVVTHRYAPGSHRAKLIVTDDHGAHGIAAQQFSVSDVDTLYVSTTTGSDRNPGTAAQPLATLTRALAIRGPCPQVVLLVANGTYAEIVELRSDLTLRGGFDPVTWQHADGDRSTIWSGAVATKGVGMHDTEVSDITFMLGQPVGISASAITVTLDACDSSVRFDRCQFVGGQGEGGSAGPNGRQGIDGVNGVSAAGETPGELPTDPFHQPEPFGGDGGWGASVSVAATAGGHGLAACVAGAGGGSASTSVCSAAPTDGGAGIAGADGADGFSRPPVTISGSFSGLAWIAASGAAGVSGCNGAGGGGGGGGGSSCLNHGGAGGSGAGGAFAGGGGGGGGGGGASIAVLLRNSSPVFDHCEFVGGIGADGRAGGSGGKGAAGGVGGNPSILASSGGKGGNGGRSGGGTAGQGGPGGPSWCIVKLGTSSPTLSSSSLTVGTGGTGGAGGKSFDGTYAPVGPSGPAAAFGP